MNDTDELLDEDKLWELFELFPDEVLVVEEILRLEDDDLIEEPRFELVDLLSSPDSLEDDEDDLGMLEFLDLLEFLLDKLLLDTLLGIDRVEEDLLDTLFKEELLLLFANLASGTSLLLSPV